MPEYPCDVCGKAVEIPAAWRRKRKHIFCSPECNRTPIVPKTCPVCNKDFLAIAQFAGKTIYCSHQCFLRYSRENEIHKRFKTYSITCAECGKTVKVRKRDSKIQKYCSQECFGKSIGQNRKGRRNPKWVPKKTVYCQRCGDPFEISIYPSGPSNARKKYCSEKCYRLPQYINCRNCGKKFRVMPGDVDRQFCCFACYRRFQGETRLEATARKALDNLGLEYIQEYKLGRYSIDFYLPIFNIAIEVDGKYWHKNKKRDQRKNKRLQKNNINLIRIPEDDFENSNPTEVISQHLNQLIPLFISSSPP